MLRLRVSCVLRVALVCELQGCALVACCWGCRNAEADFWAVLQLMALENDTFLGVLDGFSAVCSKNLRKNRPELRNHVKFRGPKLRNRPEVAFRFACLASWANLLLLRRVKVGRTRLRRAGCLPLDTVLRYGVYWACLCLLALRIGFRLVAGFVSMLVAL